LWEPALLRACPERSRAVQSSAARPASPQISAQGRTKLINITPLKLPPCALPRTSAINNPPRAVVWLAGQNCLQLSSLVRHLRFRGHESLQLSRPRDFIRKSKTLSEGYLQSKDLQLGSFLNFLSSVSGCLKCAPKVAFTRDGRPYCCAYERLQKPCHSERSEESWSLPAALLHPLPKKVQLVENIWKSCGMCRLTGFYAARMFVGFRGQSDSHLCEFAWTEFAPLRRTAIRSLTTRLNVPVVRNGFGH
jgi:hypothetical protein